MDPRFTRYRPKAQNGMSLTGDILGGVGSVASMIPGAGTIVGGALSLLGGIFSQQGDLKQQALDVQNQHKNNRDLAGLTGTLKTLKFGGKVTNNSHAGLIHLNGPKHEQGGIPFRNVEVEGGETNWKNYVFSDTLGFLDLK